MVDFMKPQDDSGNTGGYRIGIDPGTHTGFAVYMPSLGRLIRVDTLDFWGVYKAVNMEYPQDTTVIYIEVPNTKSVWHKAPGSVKAIQRQGVNVGSAIRESQLLADGLEKAAYIVHRLHPRGKVDAKRFAAYTGWTQRTNQHERDAGLLCFGRK